MKVSSRGQVKYSHISRNSSPRISVIIPARDEEKYIRKTVNSLRTGTYVDPQIIVVCNGCTDQTARVARSLGCKVIVSKRSGVSLARNLGAGRASGDVLCFLDADTLVSPTLLSWVAQTIRRGFIGGYTKTVSDIDRPAARIMWFLGNLGRNLFPAASGFMFCRKDSFFSFPEDMDIAEDTYFLLRLGNLGRLVYIRDAYVTTSMRRQEKTGYLRFIWQTFSGFFFPRKQRYGRIR